MIIFLYFTLPNKHCHFSLQSCLKSWIQGALKHSASTEYLPQLMLHFNGSRTQTAGINVISGQETAHRLGRCLLHGLMIFLTLFQNS